MNVFSSLRNRITFLQHPLTTISGFELLEAGPVTGVGFVRKITERWSGAAPAVDMEVLL